MSQMQKQLDLLDYFQARDLEELKKILNENNRRLQAAYLHTRNDINFKEWLYFSVGGRRWRIGPLLGYNPGKDKQTAVNFVIQELTGADWKDQSHWVTRHRFWGEEY
jgi:hypothetical protein